MILACSLIDILCRCNIWPDLGAASTAYNPVLVNMSKAGVQMAGGNVLGQASGPNECS